MFNIFSNYVLTEDHKSLLERIDELENKVKHLEEENIENSNLIYELMNTAEAIDRRIDILHETKWSDENDIQ